jgi:hypothetical protein
MVRGHMDFSREAIGMTLRDPANPQGVTIDARNSKTLLTAQDTQGHITLTAANDAPPVEKQQVSVMANVALNFVMKATYSSRAVQVTVTGTE